MHCGEPLLRRDSCNSYKLKDFALFRTVSMVFTRNCRTDSSFCFPVMTPFKSLRAIALCGACPCLAILNALSIMSKNTSGYCGKTLGEPRTGARSSSSKQTFGGWKAQNRHRRETFICRFSVYVEADPGPAERSVAVKSLLVFLWSMCLILPIHSAFAIDPGTADGSLQINGKSIPIRQAYAHLHDNAEGLIDRQTELRIVLADREVPESALAGIVFLPVEEMAKEGKVQGLLIELDPRVPNSLLITLLYPPMNPGRSLVTLTVSTSGPAAMKKLNIGDRRVTGEVENRDPGETDSTDIPKMDYSIKFSAPLFHELPVTADLKGKAAQTSPQAGVLRRKADALAKGDFDTVRKLSSRDANRRNDAFLSQVGPDAKSFAKEAAADMKRSIAKIQRLVVRGDRAVAIFGAKQWATFIREDGEWKSDD